MRLGRLRAGELLAVAGAVVLLIVLFLDWFAVGAAISEPLGERTSGWATLGWAADALMVVAVLSTAWLALALVTRRLVAVVLAIGVLTTVAATATLVVVALRVLVAQPDLGLGLSDAAVDVRAPAWIGLAAAAVLALGAWLSLRDERTDAPENVVVAPPPRPAPPA